MPDIAKPDDVRLHFNILGNATFSLFILSIGGTLVACGGWALTEGPGGVVFGLLSGGIGFMCCWISISIGRRLFDRIPQLTLTADGIRGADSELIPWHAIRAMTIDTTRHHATLSPFSVVGESVLTIERQDGDSVQLSIDGLRRSPERIGDIIEDYRARAFVWRETYSVAEMLKVTEC